MKLRPLLSLFSNLLILLAIGLQSPSALAQHQDHKKGQPDRVRQRIERFHQKRMNVIVQRANLTPEQQTTFSSLVKENDVKKLKVWAEIRELAKKVRSNKNLSEAEYTELLSRIIELEKQQNQLDEELYTAIQSSFPPKVGFDIYLALKHFFATSRNTPAPKKEKE